jgi:hypothetical protein
MLWEGNVTTQGSPLTLRALGGNLELYPDRVTVRNTGILSRFFGQMARTVAIRDISEVILYEGSVLLNGFLRLSVKEAAGKPIILIYPRKHNQVALAIKKALEDELDRADILPFIRALH